jgi:Isopropylmalate/homocitrate/citramalate synthases
LVLNQPTAMFSLDPAFIGNRSGVLLGKKSGLKSIAVKLDELNLPMLSDQQQKELLSQIKEESIRTKKVVSDERFREMVSAYNA